MAVSASSQRLGGRCCPEEAESQLSPPSRSCDWALSEDSSRPVRTAVSDSIRSGAPHDLLRVFLKKPIGAGSALHAPAERGLDE